MSAQAKKILLVEDEEMTARLIIYRLKSLGYEAFHSKDGVNGLKKIRELQPDLVVLDVMLPGKSGFEILQELQEDDFIDERSIKVIMLSNKKRVEDVSRGFNLGAMEYVPKPFKMDEFLLRLNRVLNQ
ncbi:response regulator transcription factor [Rhodohalobacter mucosus]|uniref:Response regulator n=1 Tax=Rhodohalobacter mucosus TaxID=2079485 RepID=A0A316TQT2_9BACT|nr:response regulator [Rhodohalobacter mucosus]PWN05609.1 response regulator [Rhodohalobacter mucosus]